MRALALISGGLDSTLAVKIIQKQGIEIIALNFKTPFCQCDKKGHSGCAGIARQVASELGIELKPINLADDFLMMLPFPRHGYGSNMNPCIDCRILMFKKAKLLMQELGAMFVISGEVLGQRPMSQHRRAMQVIEEDSGMEGLILRPLSAKLLPATIPEKKGWVDRNMLLRFNGRARRPQMQLAEEFNIKDYPCSAGGCLLTDPGFSRRVKDVILHGELNLNNIELLKVGRHFRFQQGVKLIIGRNDLENQRLLFLAQAGDYIFSPLNTAGPTALARGIFTQYFFEFCAKIIARYCDSIPESEIEIVYSCFPEDKKNILNVLPVKESELALSRI